MIKAKSQFKDRRLEFRTIHFFLLSVISCANHVEIDVPIPPDATNPKIWTSMGTATYKPEESLQPDETKLLAEICDAYCLSRCTPQAR